MSNAMSLRVPKSLYEQVKAMAAEDGVSLNQFVLLALAEKVTRQQAMAYLEHRFNELARKTLISSMERDYREWEP